MGAHIIYLIILTKVWDEYQKITPFYYAKTYIHVLA